jgi:putative transposase
MPGMQQPGHDETIRRDGVFRPVRRPIAGPIQSHLEIGGAVLPQPIRKLRPRIESFDYTGRYAYHLIMRTAHSQRVFENRTIAAGQVSTLLQCAEVTGFDVLAYCLMPNHLHTLVQGFSDDSDLRKFVHRFKQVSSFNYKKQTGKPLWQTSYYERALRQEDNFQVVADYIFANPVKDGLASDARSYAHSGGRYFDAALPDGPEGTVPTKLGLPEGAEPAVFRIVQNSSSTTTTRTEP